MDTLVDVTNKLPEDLKSIITELVGNVIRSTSIPLQPLQAVLTKLVNAKGDPIQLNIGARKLGADVTTQIELSRTGISNSFPQFRGAWVGRGAQAFSGYVPQLLVAIQSMKTSAAVTATAVTKFRTALLAAWASIISEASGALGKVLGALESVDNPKEAAGPIIQAVSGFVSGVGKIVGALILLVDGIFQAGDTLTAAATLPPGLVRLPDDPTPVGAPSTYPKCGPVGYQLPAPDSHTINPEWSDREVKTYWQPADGDRMEIDNQAMATMAQVFRDNGQYWVQADAASTSAATYFTAANFGVFGAGFHQKLMTILDRDQTLYRATDTRMDAIGNTLSAIGRSYGLVDHNAAKEIDPLELRNQ